MRRDGWVPSAEIRRRTCRPGIKNTRLSGLRPGVLADAGRCEAVGSGIPLPKKSVADAAVEERHGGGRTGKQQTQAELHYHYASSAPPAVRNKSLKVAIIAKRFSCLTGYGCWAAKCLRRSAVGFR